MTNPARNHTPVRPEMQMRGPLDTTAVNHLLDRIAAAPDTKQLVLDCSQVSSVDPVGTARLWVLARELELAGRMLRIIGLPERSSGGSGCTRCSVSWSRMKACSPTRSARR